MTNTVAIGDATLFRIIESEGPLLSPFEIFPECTAEHLAANRNWLLPVWYDPDSQLLPISIQSFLIRTGKLTILVDTCCGNFKDRKRSEFNHREWPWLERLHAAGVTVEQIDVVFCSHLHVDHVGWNTRLENGQWVPTFPNAKYLVSRAEWDFWRSRDGRIALERTGDFVTDSVLPIAAADRLHLIEGEHELAPSILVAPAYGHTPGHCAVHIHDGGQGAILSSDIFHHALQLRYPDWSTRFCIDPGKARKTRRRFLEDHAGSDRMIFPAHFPAPTGGYIEKAGDAYEFRFVDGHS